MRKCSFKFLLFAVLAHIASVATASTLQDISFSSLPGERAEIRLKFDQSPSEPSGYSIEKPARIVLDFADVENALSQKKYTMAVGEVNSSVIVSGGGRTRLIVNLNSYVPYTTRVDGSDLVIEVGKQSAGGSYVASAPKGVAPVTASRSSSTGSQIQSIDFRRGESGEGKVVVALSNPNINVDVEEVADGVEVRFYKTALPSELNRQLDVLDFATPVKLLSAKPVEDSTVIRVSATGEYDYLAYQADNEYVVSIKPLTEREIEEKKEKFAYTGEKLSLNFQSIQVRNVLQLIADFTDLNLVTSDTVKGDITLRLENVPWDQALDIVLKTKGLDKRQEGNVLMVAPSAEIAERERQQIVTQKQLQELAPLKTEYIRVRYANAKEIFKLFGGEGSDGGGDSKGKTTTGTILSARGHAIVDERTNSIMLTDTQDKIEDFKNLLERIDVPIRQVMIEARIVSANDDFRKELGLRINGATDSESSEGSTLHRFTGRPFDGNLVDLGILGAPNGSFTWNIINDNFFLGLELAALENSGYAEIVSQPKVITGDKQKAVISSGSEVPYEERSESSLGITRTTIKFKEAILVLEVTPQITPDDKVIMDINISRDSVGEIVNGQPSIDKTSLESQVLVSDGETIVLGGVYQSESVEGIRKVPLLGDIPFLGRAFRSKIQTESKSELLLFITPRIMAQNVIE